MRDFCPDNRRCALASALVVATAVSTALVYARVLEYWGLFGWFDYVGLELAVLYLVLPLVLVLSSRDEEKEPQPIHVLVRTDHDVKVVRVVPRLGDPAEVSIAIRLAFADEETRHPPDSGANASGADNDEYTFWEGAENGVLPEGESSSEFEICLEDGSDTEPPSNTLQFVPGFDASVVPPGTDSDVRVVADDVEENPPPKKPT